MSYYNEKESLHLPNIIRYLKAKGWKQQVDFPNNKLIVFDGPFDISGEIIQVVLPANEKFKDYPIRTEELIYSLSAIEDRPINSIITEITAPNIDRLQVRVLSDISKDGTLPFSYASTLINGLKDFLIAAACVEEDPQPFYRRASKVGLDYANACRFGQTNVGSFIINIESSVPSIPTKQLSLPLMNETEHFNRRVVKRIQKGLNTLKESTDEGDASKIIADYKTGLNANMCEALLSLNANQSNIDFEYSVNWSLGAPGPKGIPDSVKINHRSFEYLESAAKVLRDTNESMPLKITGKVIGLSAPNLSKEDERRHITVVSEVNKKTININITLNVSEYIVACDAHRDYSNVQVEGVLERVRNRWRLMSPHNFKVL